MDDLYYDCYQTSNVKNVEKAVRPSVLLRQHQINFKFSVEFKIFNWVQNLDYDRPEFVGADRRPPCRFVTSVCVPVGKPLSKESREEFEGDAVEEMRQAVGTAVDAVVAALPLSEGNRRRLIERAWSEASTISNRILSRFKVRMDVDFEVLVVNHHVYHPLQEISTHVLMVPAADSSVQSLKKHEVGSGKTKELSCCICLEDFIGGGGGGDDEEGCEALCMPCEHVFHGDCIKKWLQTSHYCPLCRFEMPTS